MQTNLNVHVCSLRRHCSKYMHYLFKQLKQNYMMQAVDQI